jgi:hypothetical protein
VATGRIPGDVADETTAVAEVAVITVAGNGINEAVEASKGKDAEESALIATTAVRDVRKWNLPKE